MISDERMAEAAEELFQTMLDGLPDEEACSHEFSEEFERKMKRLVRQAEHPVRRRVVRKIAGIVLILFLGFVMLLTVSPSVRAAVFGWIGEYGELFTTYYFAGEIESEQRNYELSDIPAGYAELSRSKEKDLRTTSYVNHDSSQMLVFMYSPHCEDVWIYAMSGDYTPKKVMVDGQTADLFIPDCPEDASAICWCEMDSNTFCAISGFFSEEELISMAEKIKCE